MAEFGNKKGLLSSPEEWEIADLETTVELAEELELGLGLELGQELDKKHFKEREIEQNRRMKEFNIKEKEMNEYIAALERENEDEKRKANNKIENLKRKLFEAKNINISKIIDKQNERWQEKVEHGKVAKEEENATKDSIAPSIRTPKFSHQKSFCTLCNLFHTPSAHYCHLFERWILVDHANLVMLKGESQEEVEAMAIEGKTKGTATVESFPTKTKMFQELEKIRLLKLKNKEEEERKKKKEEERKDKNKKRNHGNHG